MSGGSFHDRKNDLMSDRPLNSLLAGDRELVEQARERARARSLRGRNCSGP